MKVAVEKSSGFCLYIGNFIFNPYLVGDGFIDSRMTPETCELIDVSYKPPYSYQDAETGAIINVVPENIEPPEPWYGGNIWQFSGGVFSLTEYGAAFIAGKNSQELQSAKSAKNIEINNCRLLANTTTFTYQDKLFACDTLSRSDIDGVNGYVALFSALPQDFPGGWKAVDNSFMTINTVEEWKSFYTAMVAEGTANFIKAQNLKSLLANAQTLAEIQAIQW